MSGGRGCQRWRGCDQLTKVSDDYSLPLHILKREISGRIFNFELSPWNDINTLRHRISRSLYLEGARPSCRGEQGVFFGGWKMADICCEHFGYLPVIQRERVVVDCRVLFSLNKTFPFFLQRALRLTSSLNFTDSLRLS